jgi:hypothetical protein
MIRFLKRLFYFISFFLLFFVIKEFVSLYAYLHTINPWLGYITLSLLGIGTIYFVIIPIGKILAIPVNPSPTTHISKEQELIKKRIQIFKKNKTLIESGMDVSSLQPTREDYDKALAIFAKESEKIRRRYVSQVFYRTGIVQNGFLDAILILSSSVAMVREIFILYNGRVSSRDLWKIAREIYYSIVIGGSEAVEYATDEVFSKLASDSLKNIPFLDKILTSMADGMINAAMVTRVALITENYCTKTYITSNRDLYPSSKFIIKTAKSITSDLVNNISLVLKKMASEKTVDTLLKVGNPVGYIFEKAIDYAFPTGEDPEPGFKKGLKTGAKFIGNPLVFGIEKLIKKTRS